MTCEFISIELSDEQKAQVQGILSVGCDRQTAANFVGCSLAGVRRAMQRDATFATGVCRAEAGAELNHMRNVQQASKDEKHWRASVWWLERRSPERFGPRGAGVVTTRQLKAFVEILADALRADIRSPDDRQRIRTRLQFLADSVDQMLRDAQTQFDSSFCTSELPGETIVEGQPRDSFTESRSDAIDEDTL